MLPASFSLLWYTYSISALERRTSINKYTTATTFELIEREKNSINSNCNKLSRREKRNDHFVCMLWKMLLVVSTGFRALSSVRSNIELYSEFYVLTWHIMRVANRGSIEKMHTEKNLCYYAVWKLHELQIYKSIVARKLFTGKLQKPQANTKLLANAIVWWSKGWCD